MSTDQTESVAEENKSRIQTDSESLVEFGSAEYFAPEKSLPKAVG